MIRKKQIKIAIFALCALLLAQGSVAHAENLSWKKGLIFTAAAGSMTVVALFCGYKLGARNQVKLDGKLEKILLKALQKIEILMLEKAARDTKRVAKELIKQKKLNSTDQKVFEQRAILLIEKEGILDFDQEINNILEDLKNQKQEEQN